MLDKTLPEQELIAPRSRILDAAEYLFSEKGVHGAGLREIARRADVNVNLITYHYGTKEQLYVAVMERARKAFEPQFETFLADVERQYSPASPPVNEIVRCFYEPAFQALARNRDECSHFTLSYFREIGSKTWQQLNGQMASHIQRFATALHRAIPTARRDDLIVVLQLACLSPVLLTGEVDRSMRGEDAGWTKDCLETKVQFIRMISAAAMACA